MSIRSSGEGIRTGLVRTKMVASILEQQTTRYQYVMYVRLPLKCMEDMDGQLHRTLQTRFKATISISLALELA